MKLEKPELYSLSRIDWQFFCTLTFKRERMPDAIRQSMFFAWARKQSSNFGVHFPRLLWAQRSELGEATGRFHFHALIAGLPEHANTIATCFAMMRIWEGLGGGHARVSIYNNSLQGVDYILKGLETFYSKVDQAQGRLSADFYEFTKFNSSQRITLSESILRVIEGRRRIGKRSPSSTAQRPVIAAPLLVGH